MSVNKKYPIPPKHRRIPVRLHLTIGATATDLPDRLPSEDWTIVNWDMKTDADTGLFTIVLNGTLPENFGEGLQDA